MTPGIAERCGMMGGNGCTKLAMLFVDEMRCLTLRHDEMVLLVRFELIITIVNMKYNHILL